MEGDVAATYTLIYRFLKAQSHNKAAEAVKKAAKPIVVLHDDIEPKGPSLEDIIKGWKEKENTKSKDTDSSSEDDDPSDDSSSDSEDSLGAASGLEGDTSGSESDGDDTSDGDDNSVDMDEGTISKSSPPKPVERDTSVTLSSTGENARVAIQVGSSSKKPTKITGKEDENTSTGLDSSDSDDSDSDGSSESSASGSSDAESSSSSSGSSDTSDSSDEHDKKTIKLTPPNRTGTTVDQNTLDSSSESEDELDSKPQQDVHVAKKCKFSENEGGVTTAVTDRSQQIVRKKEKLPPKVKERFQRVKVQNLEPKQLLDNDYKARGGAMNDYGERAHRDLIVTRGAGFRKEKNKKKRGSYRGGEITMENHSIRFNF